MDDFKSDKLNFMNTIEKEIRETLEEKLDYGLEFLSKELSGYLMPIIEKHAVGFAEFIDNNCATSNNTDDKYILNDFISMGVEFTRKELFKLYIETLEK